MKNFVQKGDSLTVVAPVGGFTAGLLYIVGKIVGVAANTVLATESGVLVTEGVFSLVKTSAQAWAEGDAIYYLTNGNCANASATGAILVGYATAVAANPSSTGNVKLNNVSAPAAAP